MPAPRRALAPVTSIVLAAATATAATVATPPPARAATLDAEGDGEVHEVSCRYDVRLEGFVATVTMRQELVATGDAEAIYAFALPPRAAVVGVTVTPPGGKPQAGVVVDAAAAITVGPDADKLDTVPDLGLVRRLGDAPAAHAGDDDARDVAYELRVWPVRTGKPTVAEVTWVAPVTVVDGRLALRLPGRGDDDDLAAATATIRVAPPAGVKELRDLYVAGVRVATRPGSKAWKVTAPAGPLDIDVRPVVAKTVATWSATPLGDHGGALAVGVLRPREEAAASRFKRVVIVVDVSPSRAADRDTLIAAVDKLALGLPAARLQAVLFDREATPVLDAFARATSGEARRAIAAAIRDAEVRGGANLRGALTAARDALAHDHGGRASSGDGGDGDGGHDLIVVVSDGMLPAGIDGVDLDDALGVDAEDVTVSAVLVAADDGALPDVEAAPIPRLVAAHGGHVVAVRRGEVATRAATLARELAAPPTGVVAGVTAGATDVDVDLPPALHAGGGAVGFGWYEGKTPTRVEVATSGGDVTARKDAVARVAALATATAWRRAPGVVDDLGAIDERARSRLERRAGVVGVATSLVALDGRDELAAARDELAAKGGSFSRMPPPGEAAIAAPEEVAVEEVVAPGARYQIDTAGRIRQDLLGAQLVPAARQCQQVSLRAGGHRSARVAMEIQIAQGEVIDVQASSSAASKTLTRCLADAAYQLAVPTYTLAEDPDAVFVIRYPLTFAPAGAARKDAVTVGDGDAPAPIDAPAADDPLGDLVAP
ncbi:MAG: hypothetical protein H6708_29355 [Kofleriaceae bacterium]|nr:hypothetical protein [Kofleriaceae bacterium]